MDLDGIATVIAARARLVGAVAWPALTVFALAIFASVAGEFFSSVAALRLKGAGFEATAPRQHVGPI